MHKQEQAINACQEEVCKNAVVGQWYDTGGLNIKKKSL